MRRAEVGFTLIEVLAAIAILGSAGIAAIALVRAQIDAVATAAAREAELDDEDRLLAGLTLLTRQDLDVRLGSSDDGPYHIVISRPEPSLYRIAVSRGGVSEIEDLVTVVYRAAT